MKDSSPSKLFNWHPLLETLAFVLVLPEAALLFRFSGIASKQTATRLHVFLQVCGMIFALLGFAAVYKYHADISVSHFTSLHSWLGIASLVLLVLQYLLGTAFFYCGLPSNWGYVSRRELHQGMDLVLTVCSLLALVTGLQEKSTFSSVCSSDDGATECRLLNVTAFLFLLTIAALGVAMSLPRKQPRRRGEHIAAVQEEATPRTALLLMESPIVVDEQQQI